MQTAAGNAGLREKLLSLLDEAMAVGPACCGNIQVLDPVEDALAIVAQRGFPAPFLNTFVRVRRGDASACARAWRLGRRVAIPSVALDAAFAPFLPVAREAGFQAVQSTPLIAPDGRTVGVLSTHFAECTQPSLSEGILLDHLAGRAARAIHEALAGPPAAGWAPA